MLAQVETELDYLEPKDLLGPSEQTELQHGRGLTGFSVSLVGTLGRIVSHLRRVKKLNTETAQYNHFILFLILLSVHSVCSLRGTRRHM